MLTFKNQLDSTLPPRSTKLVHRAGHVPTLPLSQSSIHLPMPMSGMTTRTKLKMTTTMSMTTIMATMVLPRLPVPSSIMPTLIALVPLDRSLVCARQHPPLRHPLLMFKSSRRGRPNPAAAAIVSRHMTCQPCFRPFSRMPKATFAWMFAQT